MTFTWFKKTQNAEVSNIIIKFITKISFCDLHFENITLSLFQGSKLEADSQVPMAFKGRKARRQIYDCV